MNNAMNDLFTVSTAEQPEPQPFDPMADGRDPFLWALGGHIAAYESLAGWQAKADDVDIRVG